MLWIWNFRKKCDRTACKFQLKLCADHFGRHCSQFSAQVKVSGRGGSSHDVGCQYWCVLWDGLAGYLQPEPLKSFTPAQPLLQAMCRFWNRSCWWTTAKIPGRNFLDLEILSSWEGTGT